MCEHPGIDAWNEGAPLRVRLVTAVDAGWATIGREVSEVKRWTEGLDERNWTDPDYLQVAKSPPWRQYTTFEKDGYVCSFYCNNTRLEPTTCVEGPPHEIKMLAESALKGGFAEFNRCAVYARRPDGHVLFWSPRNSETATLVDGDTARDWARRTLAELA